MDGDVSMLPPRLVTDRLFLTPLGLEHSTGMFRLWSAPEVCLYSGEAHDEAGIPITLPARTPSDSDGIVRFFIDRAAQGLGFRWAMLNRSDGLFVGAIGFNHLGPCAELAYHLDPGYWGKGLMREAVAAALDWVGNRGTTTVEAFIEPDNIRSSNLIRALGFAATKDIQAGAIRYARQFDA